MLRYFFLSHSLFSKQEELRRLAAESKKSQTGTQHLNPEVESSPCSSTRSSQRGDSPARSALSASRKKCGLCRKPGHNRTSCPEATGMVRRNFDVLHRNIPFILVDPRISVPLIYNLFCIIVKTPLVSQVGDHAAVVEGLPVSDVSGPTTNPVNDQTTTPQTDPVFHAAVSGTDHVREAQIPAADGTPPSADASQVRLRL